MTQQEETKAAAIADGTADKDTSVLGHQNGPGKEIPAKLESEPGIAKDMSADPVEVTEQGDASAAEETAADDAAPAEGAEAEKSANGDAKPAEDHPPAAEVAPAAEEAVTPLAAAASKEQHHEAAAQEAPAESTGAGEDETKDKPAGPAAGSVQQENSAAVPADPPPVNGTTAEAEEPKKEDRQPEPSAAAEPEAASPVQEEKKPSTPAEQKPSGPAGEKPGQAEEQLSPVKSSEPKAAEKQEQPALGKGGRDEAGTTSDTPSVSSPTGTPFMTPPGTVQALTRRMSANSFATPPLKSTSSSDKQLVSVTSGGIGGSSSAGRTTKSPTGVKGGDASPPSTHDTKNTINVSQLLKAGAFKMQPLKDFVPYEELQRLRVEDGIDATRKEDYLSDTEFQTVFGMERDAFKKLPAWRQAQAKKKTNLF